MNCGVPSGPGMLCRAGRVDVRTRRGSPSWPARRRGRSCALTRASGRGGTGGGGCRPAACMPSLLFRLGVPSVVRHSPRTYVCVYLYMCTYDVHPCFHAGSAEHSHGADVRSFFCLCGLAMSARCPSAAAGRCVRAGCVVRSRNAQRHARAVTRLARDVSGRGLRRWFLPSLPSVVSLVRSPISGTGHADRGHGCTVAGNRTGVSSV